MSQAKSQIVMIGIILTLSSAIEAIASAPSAPPEKSPTANVGHAPNKGKIPERGKVPVKSPVANVGAAPVEGQVAVPGKVPPISVRKEGCKQHLTLATDTLFDFDQYELTPRAEQTLDEVGPMLLKYGKHPITVEGHTDSIGKDQYNQTLSERRAKAVKSWLSAHKYILGSATAIGFGEKRPVAPNATPEGTDNPAGRQLNRRVEIVIDTCH